MKLSFFERQVLWNQIEVLRHINPGGAEHIRVQQKILGYGYVSHYPDVLHLGYGGAEFSEQDSTFVVQVLEMMDGLHRYRTENGGTTRFRFDEFRGFDDNSESELCGYARFLVEDQRRWNYFGISSFNTPMPMRRVYEGMLTVWITYLMPERIAALTDSQVIALAEIAKHS